MQSETIDLQDPDDVAAATAWSRERAQAQARLNADLARQNQLTLLLDSDAKKATETALTAAARETSRAQDTYDAAMTAKKDADSAAARCAANDLPQAQAALDATIRAVSEELARLLSEASRSTSLTATIDGLALRERYHTATRTEPPLWDVATIPFRLHDKDPVLDHEIRLPVVGTTEHASLVAVLDRLDDLVDAVGDLVTAEGVHHLVAGNLVRSGAALDIAASGAVPDELEVIRTPRPGYDVTHRVLAITSTAPARGWKAFPAGVAASADPTCAAWLTTLLPDPASVHLQVTAVQPQTGARGATVELTADALGLDPFGWLRVAADKGELLARVARAARQRWAAATPEVVVDAVIVEDPMPPSPERLGLGDLLAAASAARAVLQSARALSPADMVGPHDNPAPVTPELADKAVVTVQDAEKRLRSIVKDLESASRGSGTADTIVDALLAASALGVSVATPALDQEMPSISTLRAQALAALPRARARLEGGPFTAAAGDPEGTVSAAREALSRLCGMKVPLMLPVDLPADPRVLSDLKTGKGLAGAQPADVRSWLYDHARVRPSLATALGCFDLSETLGCPARLQARATQVPRGLSQEWSAPIGEPPAGLTNIVAILGEQDISRRVAGLALDSWVQTVPATSHATGLAFHYDEPSSEPPQAIVVAVAPDVTPGRQATTWDLDTLVDIVTSTVSLARDRAVAAELVQGAHITVPEVP